MRHNISPKHKEYKKQENAIIYLQDNKTHTTSTQDQKNPKEIHR
jgi:hypothetical protein